MLVLAGRTGNEKDPVVGALRIPTAKISQVPPPLVTGSDDKLLAAFLDPANGCTPFAAPDASATGGTSGSQALNELSARANQQGTIAVVPPNDEMTLVNSAFSI